MPTNYSPPIYLIVNFIGRVFSYIQIPTSINNMVLIWLFSYIGILIIGMVVNVFKSD